MNIEHINLVIAAIEAAEPEQVIAGDIAIDLDSKGGDTYCNTAACIAGWVSFALTKNFNYWLFEPHITGARKALGITSNQASQLFMMHYDAEVDENYKLALRKLLNLPAHDDDDDEAYLNIDDIEQQQPDVILDAFDKLPPEVRKRASINVLTLLRDTNTVDWLKAIQTALA